MENQGPGMNFNQQNIQNQQSGLEGERLAQVESQLLQNMLTKGVDPDKTEIDDYMATSFLEREELAVMRDYQELLGRLRRLAKLIGMSKEEFQKLDCRKEIIKRMVTIAQTSKSKGGAGFKAVRTEKIVQEENLYQDFAEEEEESTLDKILSKASESDTQVVGNPNLGSYNADPSWE